MGDDVKKEKNVVEIDDPWTEFADNKFVSEDEENSADKVKKEIDKHEDEEDEDEFEDETEELEDEELDTETDDEPEDKPAEKKPKGKQSKEQAAIIALKREKKELEAKLAAAEAKKEEERQKARDEIDDASEIKRLVDEEGVSEAIAKRQVLSERRSKNLEVQLERDRFERKLDKMEKDYPGISDHADEIWTLSNGGKSKLTPAEIFKAKFADTDLTFDKKTKTEQEVLARQAAGKTRAKANVTATPKTAVKDVKLSREDERAFQFLKKKDPTMTRERFKKYSNF